MLISCSSFRNPRDDEATKYNGRQPTFIPLLRSSDQSCDIRTFEAGPSARLVIDDKDLLGKLNKALERTICVYFLQAVCHIQRRQGGSGISIRVLSEFCIDARIRQTTRQRTTGFRLPPPLSNNNTKLFRLHGLLLHLCSNFKLQPRANLLLPAHISAGLN